ncbi:hypothetical protein [Helicobacter pametensis]|uniref:5'-methylthioadenosine/S-adenosylhomocysteine nucleosidase family protein n=1 Tax=Helicobacter pametensis TaxID=95149 RepID=UPI00048824AE|nr:hypothetical protein [Helicobacter pametensis]
MFVCAGNGEEFEFAVSIGVGLIESAINLARVCERERPDCLIFVGSAGSYDGDMELLELCVSSEATQIESSLLLHDSYTPIENRICALSDVSHETIQRIKALGLREVVVNSSNYITTDIHHAQRIQEKGILLENMEFFSVLSVANAFEIPAIGVFCVSNYCGSEAHQEFLKNCKEVMGRLRGVIEKLEV